MDNIFLRNFLLIIANLENMENKGSTKVETSKKKAEGEKNRKKGR